MGLDQTPAVDVTIRKDPPRFAIDDFDITDSVVAWRCEGDRHDSYVTVTLRAHTDIEGWPVREVAVLSDAIRDMTAQQWNEIIMGGGMSTTPGEKIRAHLAGHTSESGE